MTLTHLKASRHRYSNTNLTHTHTTQVTIAILWSLRSFIRNHDKINWTTVRFKSVNYDEYQRQTLTESRKNYKPATWVWRNAENKRHVERDTSSEESWQRRSRWWWKLWIHRCSLTYNQRKQSHDTALTIFFFLSQECFLFFDSNILKKKQVTLVFPR